MRGRIVWGGIALLLLAMTAAAAYHAWRGRHPVVTSQVIVPKVLLDAKPERCASCHAGVAHEALPRTHDPQAYGCTVCHGGQGGEIDKAAAHRFLHPAASGCGSCHGDEDVSSAFTAGRNVFRREKCAACHAVANTAPLRWTGPPLEGLSARTTPEHVLRFLRAGAGAMPSFWPEPRDAALRDAWLARKTSETMSIAAFLFDRDDGRLASIVARRANVTGASAEEGEKLFGAIGCAACHAAASFVDLKEDWLAWFLEDPARAHPGTPMPSFRLDRREAASLAKHIAQRRAPSDLTPDEIATITDPARRRERVRCNLGEPEEMTRAKCGELLYDAYGCGSCHGGGKPVGPPLDGYATKAPPEGDAAPDWNAYTTQVLEAPRAAAPATRRMPQHRLAPEDVAALRVYLGGLAPRTRALAFDVAWNLNQRGIDARPRMLVAELACASCHDQGIAPSLRLEGARVDDRWVADYLKDPGARGVRPPLHPEWVWGSLVPLDKLAVRMPTYPLSGEDVVSVEMGIGVSSHGREARPKPLTNPADRAKATALLKPCLGCHYAGDFPVERAKTSLATLAPDLAQTSTRLRPEWVRAFLSNPRTLPPHTTVDGDPELVLGLLYSMKPTP